MNNKDGNMFLTFTRAYIIILKKYMNIWIKNSTHENWQVRDFLDLKQKYRKHLDIPIPYILQVSRKYISHLLLVIRGARETNILCCSNSFTVHSKPWKMNFVTQPKPDCLDWSDSTLQSYITFFKTNSNVLE